MENIKFEPYIIGSNLRELRERRNLSQMKVAEYLDISNGHYARMEEGVRGMSIKMLFKVMNFFETDANTILGLNGGNS